MIKKNRLVAIAILVVIVLAVAFLQIGKDGPEDVLKKFVNAYNSLDMEQMLDCIEPRISRPMRSMMGLAKSLLGVNPNDIFGALPLLSSMLPAGYVDMHTMPHMTYEVQEMIVTGNSAVLRASISLIATGSVQRETVELQFVKVDGKWYMTE